MCTEGGHYILQSLDNLCEAWQFTSTLSHNKLSQVDNTGLNTSSLVEHAYNPIHRRYQYDPAGELVRTLDKLRGEIKYEYEANGQLRSRSTARSQLGLEQAGALGDSREVPFYRITLGWAFGGGHHHAFFGAGSLAPDLHRYSSTALAPHDFGHLQVEWRAPHRAARLSPYL